MTTDKYDIPDRSGETIKGYELIELIGVGGFGAVYKAFQPLIKREVAVKIILPDYANNPEFIRRFEAEAQLVAHLEHLHIVPLYDYWRDASGAYLVMRWLRGGSLQKALESGLWPLEEAGRLVDQLADALYAAHRNGVIHRDLKPANILLDEDNNAFLADFGIAKDLQHISDYSEMIEKEEEAEDTFMGSPAYLAPEQIRVEQVSPQTDIYSFGIMMYEILTGITPFHGPVSTMIMKHLQEPLPHLHEIRPDLPGTLHDVIEKATEKDPADRYKNVLEMAADFRRALAQTPTEELAKLNLGSVVDQDLESLDADTLAALGLTEDFVATQLTDFKPENPYKGLRAFQEADADDFFGRESLVDQLLERMKGEGQEARFISVVGPSGSGKSSVVKAGVLPRLRRGAVVGSGEWFIVEMIPGAHPMEELEAALLRIAVNPPASLLEQLEHDERGLVRALKRVLPAHTETAAGSELVLMIDQFEEIFTLVENEPARTLFLNSLLTAVNEPDSRLRVIVTLRADFYDRPLRYPAFGNLVRDCTEVVLPLSVEELERAITEPAQRVGLQLEAGLTTAIVADVAEQPSALPLLQYALTELYERRDGRWLTLNDYHVIGGVTGALARRADEIYSELDATEQTIAEQVFLRLVTLGEGSEDTRRRVLLSELLSLQRDEDAIQKVVDTFAKYRLLTFDRDPITRTPTIEVAHEALIRQWQKLRDWLETNRESLRLQRRLAVATNEWLNANKDTSFLASGTRLEQFESWMTETPIALTTDEKRYLESSLKEREKQRAAEAVRKAKEEALERRSRNVLRALVGVMTLATIGALVLTLFAFNQRSIAEENAAIAEQNAATATVAQGEAVVNAQNAATAAAEAELNANEARSLAFVSSAQLALANSNTDLAIPLALEANQVGAPSVQTRRTLAEAAYAPGTRFIFQGHSDRVTAVAVSPDGRTALTGARDAILILWDTETGEEIRRFEGHADWIWDVAYSPDSRMALSASQDRTLILWDLETGEAIRTFEGHEDAVRSVAFSADGTRALSGSQDRTMILWDIESGDIIVQTEPINTQIFDVALSPSGFSALSGNQDGSVILWNIQSGTPLLTFTSENGGHTSEVWSVAYTADEGGMLTGSDDGTMLLWRFEVGQPVMRFEGHSARVTSVALSADGTRAVSGSEDNSVILWDVTTGAVLRRFIGHTFLVYSVGFSPDGSHILSGSWDGTARYWDTRNGAQVQGMGGASPAHTDDVRAVAYSPDGMIGASAAADNSLILWDVMTGEEIRRLEGHDGPVNVITFSPDGTQMLTGSDDETLILWDVESGTIIYRLEGHTDAVWAVDFSPDGRYAVSGSRDNTIHIWNLETGESEQRLFGHTFVVTDVAYSPDGTMFVSSSFDNLLILWDVDTGEEIRRFEGHTDWIWTVEFSPDGQTLLSGSADNSMMLWDVETGRRLRTFEGHSALIYSLDISADGQYVVSGGADRAIIIWDIATGEEVQRFDGHSDYVRSVAFSPDGRFVLSGSGDNSVRLWQIRLSLDELVTWVRANRYIRDLTCAERERYAVEPLCPTPTPVIGPDTT